MADENLGTAVLALTTDDKGLDKGLDAAERKSRGWADKVGGILKGGLLVGAGVAVAVGAGLVKVLGDSAAAAMDAERVSAQLDSTLKAVGKGSGQTSKSINDLSLALSEVTPIEDDTITATQSMLLTFKNVGGDTFPRATRAILDMATGMNAGATPSAEQLQGTAIQLGKALNDPIKGISALARVGVQFSEEQKAAIAAMVETNDLAGAQAIILKEVESQFGGAAEAAGGTFAGQMQILNNALGNVKEEIGGALIPVLSDLATEYGPALVQFAKDAGEWIATKLIPAIVDLVEWLKVVLPPVIKFLTDAWNNVLLPSMTAVYEFIRDYLIPTVAKIVDWLKVNIPLAIAAAKLAWERLQPAIKAIEDVIKWVIQAVKDVIEWLGKVKTTLANLDLPNPFAGLLANIQAVIQAIKDAIEWVKKLPGKLGGGASSLLGGAGSNMLGAQSFGGLAVAGAGASNSNAFNVTINAPGGDPIAIERATRAGVLSAARAMGVR